MVKRSNSRKHNIANRFQGEKAPLIEHLKELRRRLFIIALAIAIGSAAAYAFETQLINALLRPSHGQHFIYTSPMGGINFVFSVCIYVGIAISLPVIVYHFLQFLRPLMRYSTSRFIFIGSTISGLVAVMGIAFGYFIGLPAALHFLLHQFVTSQIQPLITIQAYLSFVTAYLLGSALMFQLPLFLIFINRIKPLQPKRLLHFERHIIVVAFIVGFIMNPTPNLIDQLLVVVPIILMYQLGILLIWFINRSHNETMLHRLLAADSERQAGRMQLAHQLRPVVEPSESPAPTMQPPLQITEDTAAAVHPVPAVAGRVRPRSYDNIASAPTSPQRSYRSIQVRLAED
jgi:sec-independent protein translocase protein TatC